MSDENGKTIKFKFEIDQQSFNSVKQAIESLGQSFSKINAAAGGLMGGGGFANVSVGGQSPGKQQLVQAAAAKNQGSSQVSGPSMTKVILDNASAFKKFAAEGKESSKIMTDALKRDLTEQERSLDKLQTKLKNLSEEYQAATKAQKDFLSAGKTGQAAAMGAHASNINNQISQTTGQVLQTNNQLANAQQLINAGQPPSGFNGMLSRAGINGINGGAGVMSGLGTVIAGAVTAAVVGTKEYMAGTRMFSNAEAERGGLVNSQIAALRRGDISDIQARRMILQDPLKRKDFEAQTGTTVIVGQALDLSKAESYMDATANTAMDVLGRVTGGLSNRLFNRQDSALGSRLTTAAIENDQYAKQQAMIEAEKQSTEFQKVQFATNYFNSSFGNRIAATKMLGYRLRRDPDKRMAIDDYGDQDVSLTRRGFDVSQKVATYGSLIQAGGTTLGRITETQMEAARAGQGGYAEAVRAMSMASGGDLDLGRTLVGMGIGTGQINGKDFGKKMDVNAGFQLSNVLGGYDPRQGVVDPTGLMAGFMSGIGGSGNSIKDMMNVQAFGGGLNLANRFTSGSLDDLQKGKNTIFAANTLGKGANTYAIDYLANMDIKKLSAGMGGSIDNTASNLGLTKENFQTYGNKVFGSMFDGYYGKGKIGDAVDRFKKSKLGISEYVASNKGDIGLLADAISLGSGGGMELDTARAFLRTQAGIGAGGSAKTGGVGGGRFDEATQAKLDNEAEFKRQDSEGLKDMTDKGSLVGDLKSVPRQAQALEKMGTDLSGSVKNVTDALNGLADKINKLNIGGGSAGFRADTKGPK